MPAKIFGQYLLEKGLITRDMLLDAMQYQQTINKPLCALAMEKGYLTKDQLAVLDKDQQPSDRKFMELAIKKGMLTFSQLEELAEGKSERWLFLGEALVQRGHINLVQLQQSLEEYRKQLAPVEKELYKALKNVPEKEVISSFLDVTVDIFVHYTRQIVKVITAEETTAEPEDVAYIFTQQVVGDKKFLYALALPEQLTLSIASHILGEEHKEVDDIALDAVSEFVNVVIGNGCTRLSMNNFKVTAQPPRIMTKEMMKKQLPKSAIAVNMKTMRGEFRVLFFFESSV